MGARGHSELIPSSTERTKVRHWDTLGMFSVKQVNIGTISSFHHPDKNWQKGSTDCFSNS